MKYFTLIIIFLFTSNVQAKNINISVKTDLDLNCKFEKVIIKNTEYNFVTFAKDQIKRENIESLKIIAKNPDILVSIPTDPTATAPAYKKAAEVIGPNSLCPNRPLYANAMSNIGHHLVEGQGKTKGLDYENIQQAIEYYKEALRWVPEHHATWYNLGIAFQITDDLLDYSLSKKNIEVRL